MKTSLLCSLLLLSQVISGSGMNGDFHSPDNGVCDLELSNAEFDLLSATGELLSCNAPGSLSTTHITQTTATWNWSAVYDAVSYSVQWRYAGGTWYDLGGGPWTSTWLNLGGLQPGTTYEWRVRSNCGYGMHSAWSYPASFTTLGGSCSTPGYPSTTNITGTSATFSWSPVSGASGYSVQTRLPNGTWYDAPGNPYTSTSATVGGFQPNTTYQWRVRANCGYGQYSNWTKPITFTTLGAQCHTPQWPSTSHITSTSAKFSWSPVSGASSYSVQTRLPNGTWYDVPGSPFTSTSTTVQGLYPHTTYQWRVRANCGYGQYSNWTKPITFTTTGSSCSAPHGLHTSNITQKSAKLHWYSVPEATSYSIQWRYPGGTWYTLNGGPWTSTWLTLGGLQPGTTYEWRVRSNCGYGTYSSWSYPASFTTLGAHCYTPGWPSTSHITSTSAKFSWSAVYGAYSYSVQTRLPNGTWYDAPGSPFTSTSATVGGFQPNTTYQWRVRANCGYEQHSNWTKPITFTTTGSSCIAPHGLYTSHITQNSAKLHWSAVSGAVSYSIQWRYPGGNWYTLNGGPWTSTSLTIGGLQPGTAYEWRVRANCSYWMTSPWSHPASFTTLGANCHTPGWPSTSYITETTAKFSWSAVSGAHSYSVQTRLPNGTWYDAPGSPFTSTSVTVGGFLPNTTYQWRVRANCGYDQHSNWTSPVTFTTSGSGSYGNDECSDAIVLTVGSSCSYTVGSNVNATPSIPPPPSGGCPSNGYKDVWFRFTMPDESNPVATIRTTAGSLTDAVMAVYIGTDCSDLTALACEDDNMNGNGSVMPVISVAGYPNETIWVRIWGYNGSQGTFNICVFDYHSNNFTDDDNPSLPVMSGDVPEHYGDGLEISQPEAQPLTPTYRIAPNPVDEVLYVTLSQTELCTVSGLRMTDISGKVVFNNRYQTVTPGEFHEAVDVSQLVPGIYILHIITTTGILSEKVSVVDR